MTRIRSFCREARSVMKVVLPDGHDLTPLYLCKQPHATIAITLRNAFSVGFPPVGMMPFKQTVMEPAPCAPVVYEDLQDLSESTIFPPPSALAFDLAATGG